MTSVVRIAAVGDIHVGLDTGPVLGPPEQLAESADCCSSPATSPAAAPGRGRGAGGRAAALPVPVIAVLGNHDYESDAADDVREIIAGAGVTVLDGDSATIEVGDVSVGVAGTPGFGGGFPGASCSEFGEPLMKAFVAHTRAMATALCRSLSELDTDVRVAMTHYSPIEATLVGERLEIYPFLGSYLLAEAIDTGGAHLAVHGHAHRGSRAGETVCGVPVRNVAQPLLGRPYTMLHLSTDGLADGHP
jgi:Icc-related predicted phosphoesterase